MATKKVSLITILIVVISVSGILYFGLQAVVDPLRETTNPYAYDMDAYETVSDSSAWILIRIFSVDLQSPGALAVDNQNHIIVAGKADVVKFSNEGDRLSSFSVDVPVTCMAVDWSNLLFLGMGDHIEIRGEDGYIHSTWESQGERAVLTSVAISGDLVYIADAGQFRVWQSDRRGRLIRMIDGKSDKLSQSGFVIPSPCFDVAVGPDGSLWAANTGRHRLENYDLHGNLIQSWGDYSTRIQDFCGCCNPSHFAILPDGTFITAEKGIPRVKAYDAQGVFQSVVAGSEVFLPGTVGLDIAVGRDQTVYVLDPRKKQICIYQIRKKHKT